MRCPKGTSPTAEIYNVLHWLLSHGEELNGAEGGGTEGFGKGRAVADPDLKIHLGGESRADITPMTAATFSFFVYAMNPFDGITPAGEEFDDGPCFAEGFSGVRDLPQLVNDLGLLLKRHGLPLSDGDGIGGFHELVELPRLFIMARRKSLP